MLWPIHGQLADFCLPFVLVLRTYEYNCICFSDGLLPLLFMVPTNGAYTVIIY